jgi:membrane associated rhomboid family serine protease
VQCVDCVAEAARALPTQRTVFGGVARGGRPVITLTLIGLCVVSFVLQLVVPSWTDRWLFSPRDGFYDPYRFITVTFLHSTGGFYLHILFNMAALWFVGPHLEQAFGRARFLTLFLLSAAGGSVGSLLFVMTDSDLVQASVGASGAVFGLFGAALVLAIKQRGDVRGVLSLIGINLIFTFTVPNIAWQAHVGGLVTGALLAAAYAWAPRNQQKLVAFVAPVVLAGILYGASLLKYSALGAFG